MIKIFSNESDDSGFIEIVEIFLNSFIQNYAPEEIYVVKIDNWFDFKWREFAGKLFGAVGHWSEELKIPPFIPDRVSEQLYFQKQNDVYLKQDAPDLHIYQSSGENITDRKTSAAFSSSGLLFWFSGNTKNTLRGSIMIYQIEKENHHSQYISFLKKEAWQIYKTDGISKQEVLNLI